ncbi:MAG: HIT family protein [Thermoanaerobaculia bacterium]
MLDADCVFCRIIRGEIPSFQVFDDERTLAFMDINPANPGHVLVIPKVHAESIFTIEESFLRATLLVVQRVARAVQKVFEPYGLNIVQANGPGAAQSVLHVHWHVLPRAKDDGLAMNWSLRPGDMATLADAAERIRLALEVDSHVHWGP